VGFILSETLWPSGLRRWLQAPVRKGVGSNPTGVMRVLFNNVFLFCMRAVSFAGGVRCTFAFAAAINIGNGTSSVRPPWPNGQGVGLLIRRLRVRVPQGVYCRMAYHLPDHVSRCYHVVPGKHNPMHGQSYGNLKMVGGQIRDEPRIFVWQLPALIPTQCAIQYATVRCRAWSVVFGPCP
jgi:hypothetical protein